MVTTGNVPPQTRTKSIRNTIFEQGHLVSTLLTVQDSATFVQTLMKNQPLNVNNYQPGLMAANIVLGRILGPPFVWRFNRANVTVAITETLGTDYVLSIPKLGRIEKQWLLDVNQNVIDLNGAVELAKVSGVQRPTLVAPVYDDNQGNITMRFNSVPDQNYTAAFDYQQKAPLLTGWSQPFGNVPDEFAFVFVKMFLAECALLVNDARFEIWNRSAAYALLAAQDGLDAQAKNIFLEQMLNIGRTSNRSLADGQGGSQGRTI